MGGQWYLHFESVMYFISFTPSLSCIPPLALNESFVHLSPNQGHFTNFLPPPSLCWKVHSTERPFLQPTSQKPPSIYSEQEKRVSILRKRSGSVRLSMWRNVVQKISVLKELIRPYQNTISY